MPSPRDIGRVIQNWDKLEEDQLRVKYFKEWTAYDIIRLYFLPRKQYTHLVICPDDLVFTQNHLDVLKRDLEKFDLPVLCGVCNVDMTSGMKIPLIKDQLPSLDRKTRHFEWMEYSELKEKLTRVIHAGFPLQIIRRDVVEKIQFESDSQRHGEDWNKIGNIDLMFSIRCAERDIPIFADREVRMIHLRDGPPKLLVGERDPEIQLYSCGVLHILQRFERHPETLQISQG